MRTYLTRNFRAVTGKRRRRERVAVAVEPLEARQLLSTYYVSNAGSDGAAGTVITAPWKTITRVNAAVLKPGDQVLFAAGQTFSGSIYIPSREGGTAAQTVLFSNYGGTARATIKSDKLAGIDVAQTAGITITNLNFVGAGATLNTNAGIYVHTDFLNKTLVGLNIKNVEVSGYGKEGIRINIAGAGSTLSSVRIEQVSTHDNLWSGLKSSGSRKDGNRNFVIDHVKAYNNWGDRAASGVTGSGIWIEETDGCLINRCIAYNNGKDGAAPVGIWASYSNRVTIQYCESYNNNTATATDGGGFDFDWDVTNSTIQYCYSHNNAGPGYLLGAGQYVNSGNTLRYNVSENDGRENGRAAIHLWGNIANASIYNNVVYMAATGNSNSAAFYIHNAGAAGKVPVNLQVRNNIFYTTGGVKLINITSDVATKGTMLFAGNCYYSGTGAFSINFGDVNYTGLSAWRAQKKQEMFNGAAAGYQGDPKLANAGLGGTIGNADLLKNLAAYKLQTTSPLINRGVAQPTFLASSTLDFYGGVLPKGGKYDIGVNEVA
jgi:hypothetical protein